jgi:glycerophosphoryl diester phosphodiesterase
MPSKGDRMPTKTQFLQMVLPGTAVIAMIVLSAVWSSAELTADPVLVGRAVLPADTFAPGPTSGTRIGPGPINGREVPFDHQQPVQGFSAVLDNHDGTFLAMSDNGFGSLENSADYHLRVYTIRPDFETRPGGSGVIVVERFIELHDPDTQIPFAVTNHFTEARVLTGADFDLESMQRAPDDTLWFGDEFGPLPAPYRCHRESARAPHPFARLRCPRQRHPLAPEPLP